MNLSGIRLLLIDDMPDARAITRAMLKELGITQIFEAADGREGLNFLDMAPDMIDLVMCDWNMPKMTGLDLLKQIRSVYVDLPFLMVTGRGDSLSVIDAKSAGVTAYILKPFSQNQLEAKLRLVCQRMICQGKLPASILSG